MRLARLMLLGHLCVVLASCSVDYAGILSGKACDPSGACAGGYVCDRASWKCLSAGEHGPGETADGGPNGDTSLQDDSGAALRDYGVVADGADDVPDMGPAPDGGTDASVDSGWDGAQDSGIDGALDAGADASEDSGSDGGTDTGACTPTPHAGAICFNNDVYWVDSCGFTEEMKEDCTGPQVCVKGACCTPATCASLGKACGTWDDGCGSPVACLPCDGSKLCLDGTSTTSWMIVAVRSAPLIPRSIPTTCSAKNLG